MSQPLRSQTSLLVRSALLGALMLPAAAAQVEDIGADQVTRFFLSASGEAGAGRKIASGGAGEVFRWTAAGGIEVLGVPNGLPGSAPVAISADGSFVLGRSTGPQAEPRALRWDAAGAALDLTPASSLGSISVAMSEDGRTVAFNHLVDQDTTRAALWTEWSGFIDLHPPGPDPSSRVVSLSGNGSTAIIATTTSVPAGDEYFLWTAAAGLTPFETVAGAGLFPSGLSHDGSVVVGRYDSVSSQGLFRYVQGGALEMVTTSFEYFPGPRVSADGGLVYGSIFDQVFNTATSFYSWDPAGALEVVQLPTIVQVSGASADGSVLVGNVAASGSSALGQAFRWSSSGGIEDLDAFDGESRPSSILADGSVAAGVYMTAAGGRGVLWRTDDEIGASYCGPGVPNSTGVPGQISLGGTNISEFGSLILRASHLPQNTFGFFLASAAQDFVQSPAGFQGNLCLGGSIGRFVGAGQVGDSGAAGAFSIEIDPSSLPGPMGPVLPTFGERWYFQAWHRDLNPTATSNFTDGVSALIF